MQSHVLFKNGRFPGAQTDGVLSPIWRIADPNAVTDPAFLIEAVAIQHGLPGPVHIACKNPRPNGL